MGNRSTERTILFARIGLGQGWQDVNKRPSGRYEYTPEFNPTLTFNGVFVPVRGGRHDFKNIERGEQKTIELLPPLPQDPSKLPPPELNIESVVIQRVANSRASFLTIAGSGRYNGIRLNHARGFGFLPEDVVIEILEDGGYVVAEPPSSLNSFGDGRKRIQTHIIHFKKR